MREVLEELLFVGLALVVVLGLAACGSDTKADGGYHAQEIAGVSGYRCFVIKNDAGNAVGGNCTP